MSDGTIVENPKFLAKTAQKIKKAQAQKRRKRAPNWKKSIKASKKYRKAQKKVSRLSNKVANQRQNWQHQVAAQIATPS